MYHSHCFEKVVSITMEVGNSEDGFWPKPSRIAPIAEQSWWPAYYLLHAAGEQLQLQWISLTPDPKKSNAVLLTATVQNNGLAKLSGDVAGCAKATSASGKTTTRLEPGEGWSIRCFFFLSLDPFLPYVRAHSSHISPVNSFFVEHQPPALLVRQSTRARFARSRSTPNTEDRVGRCRRMG